jgi:molecular chaperone DnaK
MSDAEKYATQDKEAFELATAKNEAESLVYLADKTISELKDKLSKEQFDKIEDAKKKLQDALSGTDVGRIRAESEALKKALQDVGGSMYQQQGADSPPPGGEGAGAHGTSGGDGEDVVEGKYEKVDK